MSGHLSKSIVEALGRVLPNSGKPHAVHEPCFMGAEWKYLKDCMDTGWVSSCGAYVERFEKTLADFTGAGGAVATVNGTAALHICLLLAQVRAGDEVLMPALTFVATANSVSYCGATPHFVDSELLSFGVDAAKLTDYLLEVADIKGDVCWNRLTQRPIKALVVVHVFGHPSDLDALREVCERFRLVLIEDATESIGSYYKGRHTGANSNFAALSFNGNKTITTGGGGAILTMDLQIAKRAKHLTTTARTTDKWSLSHDEVGYNYRMPNVNAAIGCGQLEQLPYILKRKRNLATQYAKVFHEVKGLRFLSEPDYAQSNYWLNALIVERCTQKDFMGIFEATEKAGFMCRPIWKLLHMLPMYSQCPRMDLSVAEDLQQRVVAIPSSPKL